eukprot:1552623-Rhodomonas_salina.1
MSWADPHGCEFRSGENSHFPFPETLLLQPPPLKQQPDCQDMTKIWVIRQCKAKNAKKALDNNDA